MRKLLFFAALAATASTLAAASASGERLVYETNSLYHHIVVSETDNVRILRFHKGAAREALGDSYAQGVISRTDPHSLHMLHARYAMLGAALVDKPKNALCIGLGAGTLPKFFARAFPDCRMDVAELDGEVEKIARRYFFLSELDNMTVAVEDGRTFLRRSKKKYDVIFLDAYRDKMIPFHLMTEEFFELVKEKLAPGGVLVSNIAVDDKTQLYPWMLRTYQKCFPTILSARVPRSINKVLLCFAEKDAVTVEKFQERAAEFAGRVTLGFDVAEYAGAYVDKSSRTPTKKVLTDQYAPVNLMRYREADAEDWKY